MSWREEYQNKRVSADEAVSSIVSGSNIMISGANSAPPDLVSALCRRYEELENVTIWSGLLMYPFEFLNNKYKGHLNFVTCFFGPLERMLSGQVNMENFFFHFSDMEEAIKTTARPELVLMEVSPPDNRGFMCLGPAGIMQGRLMIECAQTVIVQVNEQTPYIYGMENVVHVSEVHAIVEASHPLPELPQIPIMDEERRIGEIIAERIPDGATIQIGIGGVANAVGYFLKDKKRLGVHTEMLTDSMVALYNMGVITGESKTFHPGKMLVGGVCIGSKSSYDFVDHNQACEFAPVHYVNNRRNIAQNDVFYSINNALTVDLTGQVASESIGHSIYSGTGGQVDFLRGADLAKNGVSYIALNSATSGKDGQMKSRIVSAFKPGTIVTSLRSDVMNIVTEYGIAELRLKTTSQRVKAMIDIAHPECREQLMREAHEAGLLR